MVEGASRDGELRQGEEEEEAAAAAEGMVDDARRPPRRYAAHALRELVRVGEHLQEVVEAAGKKRRCVGDRDARRGICCLGVWLPETTCGGGQGAWWTHPRHYQLQSLTFRSLYKTSTGHRLCR